MMAGLLFLAGTLSAGTYSGGSGTEEDPYRISTPADWQEFMTTPQDWDKHFQLTGPLDLAGIPLTPIGNYTTKFTGEFWADGWTISHVQISQPTNSYVGLFGYTMGARICDLLVEDGFVEGQYWVGGIAGRAVSSRFEACGWRGGVRGVAYVGGIVGDAVGGSSLIGCGSMGTITGSRYMGGAAGNIWDGMIYYCYSQASVLGVPDPLGGSEEDLGGLVGMIEGFQTRIVKCYAAGQVQGSSSSTPNVGGLIGLNNSGPAVADSFWDIQASGQSVSAGGIGQMTAQMKRSSLYINAGWDFVTLWEIGEHQTYPYIRTRPSADLNRDGRVALEDFAILAEQWLTEDIQPPSIPGYVW